MRLKRRLQTLCLLLIPFLVTAGCLSPPLSPIKLGTNLWPGYEPLYLAREQGYLSGNDVALVELLSASEVMRAYRNGAIDAAALTLDEVISLREAGLRPVIVQVADISNGADVILARPGFKQIQDLRGKRVGVEATALGAYMLSRALALHGMNATDVEIVHLEVNEHHEAWLKGQVDAVVTFEPVRQQLVAQGAVILFDSSMIPGEVVDLLVVRESLLKSHRRQIHHLIDAWHRALEYLHQSPEPAAEVMTARIGGSAAEVLRSLQQLELPGPKRSSVLMSGKPPELQKQAEALARLMLEQGLMQQLPDLSGLVYADYPSYETDH